MIKAKELINVSIENSKDKIEECINTIEERLIKSAKNGEFSYIFNGRNISSSILHYVSNIIVEEGYKVNYSNSMLEITWYDTINENKKIETAISKSNKSVQKSEKSKGNTKDSSIPSSPKE